MHELPTVTALVDAYARVGTRADDVDTIHADTVTVVATDRESRLQAAAAADTEE
jgi:hypothetical protein